MALIGSNNRYKRKVATLPASAAKPAKNAQPTTFATRSGTMVCVSSVATKKIAPTRANKLARVILASTISSRRLNNASDVTLLGSRPSWIRIFATRKLSAAASRIRSSIVDRSALLKFIGSSGRLGGAKRFSDSNERLGQRPIRYEEEASVGMAPPAMRWLKTCLELRRWFDRGRYAKLSVSSGS